MADNVGGEDRGEHSMATLADPRDTPNPVAPIGLSRWRDHHRDLADLGARVYGLSTQTTEYQREMVERLRVPFAVLSDAGLAFTQALALPTFTVDSMTLIKRLTLIAAAGTIDKVFYPVFPPDRNADEVIGWLSA